MPELPELRLQTYPFGIDWSQHRTDHVTKVGIVVRTRDRPVLLPRALDSVVAQTFTDWHLVVVNHGGDPGPVESAVDAVAGRAAGKIEILHLDSGGGMERAANAGLERLDAEFVVIHDDDDTWLPEFLARTVDFLDDDERRTFGAVVTHGVKRWERVIDGVVEVIADEEFNEPKAYVDNQRLFGWNRILTNHTMIRSAVFGVLGPLNESLAVIGDWEFNLRLAAVTDIGLIPEVLARYHLRVDGDNLNTITAGEGSHLETDARLRAALLRRYLAADPSRLGLLVAQSHDDEMARRLDERILQVAEQIDWRTHHTGNRINDMHDRIIAMDGVHARLDALLHRLDEVDRQLVEVRVDTSRLRAAVAAVGAPIRPLRRARERWRLRRG